MKIRVTQALYIFALLLAGASTFAELKIAVVDPLRAIAESEEAKGGMKSIQDELTPEQDRLRKLNGEIIEHKDKIQKDHEVMSSAELNELQNTIEIKTIDLEAGAQKLQKEFKAKQDQLNAQLAPKFEAVLRDLIDLEGYDFVLRTDLTLWVNPKHDVTRKVTEKLNDKVKVE